MTSWSSAAAVGAALTGGGGKILIVVLVTIAIVALVIAFVLVFGRDRESVESRLAGYTYPEGDESAAPGTAGESEGLAETRVVRQAVDLTSALAERAGLLARVERLLEQGDLPLRPAEALFFYLAGVVITALFLVIVAPSLPIALGLTVILAIIPPLQVVRAGASGSGRSRSSSPTRSTCSRAPCGPGSRSSRVWRPCPRRRASRPVGSSRASSPRPAWAGTSRTRSRTRRSA
ncbi:MAG: hypothetical protein M5U14_04935 [Acidimicrobiia bacterium]|nr:hypothetical protein [Acidimicrobiia bacterium]